MWSRTADEVVSTHGYFAGKINSQIQVCEYTSMQQIARLKGHTRRFLYLAMSPDGDTIVPLLVTKPYGSGLERYERQKRYDSTEKGWLSPFAKLR